MKGLSTARTRPKSKAHQKLDTLNPGTIALANKIIRALITSVNNPKVKILIGKEIATKSGLMVALSNPKTRAAIRAPTKVVVTPGKIYAAMIITKAETSQFKINAIKLNVKYINSYCLIIAFLAKI